MQVARLCFIALRNVRKKIGRITNRFASRNRKKQKNLKDLRKRKKKRISMGLGK